MSALSHNYAFNFSVALNNFKSFLKKKFFLKTRLPFLKILHQPNSIIKQTVDSENLLESATIKISLS